jgi:uncharacterized protein (DUF488 family)
VGTSERALITVGHGRTDREELGERLTTAGIGLVVDIRRFPGSRTSPDVGADALQQWLPERGIGYRWEQQLGGRRALAADEPSPDTWWTVAAFRAYAAYTRTADFAGGIARLLDDVTADDGPHSVTVMCSESVWWRCHRRLVADVVQLVHGVPVLHLMPDGRLTPHRPAAGARPDGSGHLVWDAAAP